MPTETTATTRTNDKLTGNASVGTEFVPTLMEGCNILKFLHIQVSPHGTLKRNGHSLVRNSRTLAADLPEKSNLRMWQRLDRCCGAVLSVAADITRAVSSRRDNDPPKHETSRLMLLRMNAHRRANPQNFLGTHDVPSQHKRNRQTTKRQTPIVPELVVLPSVTMRDSNKIE